MEGQREVKSTSPYGKKPGNIYAIYHIKEPRDMIPGYDSIPKNEQWRLLNKSPYMEIQHQFYGDDRVPFNPDNYEKVAVATFKDKHDSHRLWRLTNNVDESWSKDFVLPKTFVWGYMKRIKPLHIGKDGKEWGLRSSMVGDIFHDLTHDRMWIIANMGLEEVSNPENKSFAAESFSADEDVRTTRVFGTGKYRFNQYGRDAHPHWQYRFNTKDEAIKFLCRHSQTVYWLKKGQEGYEVVKMAESFNAETFESPASCNICGKTFDSFLAFDGHYQTHFPSLGKHRKRAESYGRGDWEDPDCISCGLPPAKFPVNVNGVRFELIDGLCPNCIFGNRKRFRFKPKAAEGREETQRMTRAEAEALADKVVKLVTPYVDRVKVCGSYRRGSPRPGDLDVVIIPKKGVTLPEIVKAIKPAEVHWLGEKKAQVLIDDHNVDFRTSSPKGWGAALLYFTGPAGYNIGMRVRAKKMGMKLNEYGIFDRNTNAYLGGATEDEIYTVLGKTLKLPAMRAEAVMNSCYHCGAKGELMTMPTRMGRKTFCGPVCLYKWEGGANLGS